MFSNRSEKFDGLSERDRINAQKFNRWFIIFSVLFAAAIVILGPVEGGINETAIWRIVLAFLPVIPGILALSAYFRFIRHADELIKQIHFEAAATGFIVVVSAGYLVYLAGQVLGQWEDSGAIIWLLGFLAYVINVRRSWKRLDV